MLIACASGDSKMAICRKICGHRDAEATKTKTSRLRCWPVRVFAVLRLRRLAGFKPRRNFLRRDCPSRQMGVDGAGGDDQSAIEFRSREIPGFRFGIKRLGQAGISSLYQGATPGYFKSDIPSMILPDPGALIQMTRGRNAAACRCVRMIIAAQAARDIQRRWLDLDQGLRRRCIRHHQKISRSDSDLKMSWFQNQLPRRPACSRSEPDPMIEADEQALSRIRSMCAVARTSAESVAHRHSILI